MTSILEKRIDAVKAAKADLQAAHRYAVYPSHCTAYMEYCEGELARCEARLARTRNRVYWSARVFKELYENKILVEEYETPEHALLRFLLDGVADLVADFGIDDE
jgi:hypothetical protein